MPPTGSGCRAPGDQPFACSGTPRCRQPGCPRRGRRWLWEVLRGTHATRRADGRPTRRWSCAAVASIERMFYNQCRETGMHPVPSALTQTERVCHASADGRHSRLDLSDLRWLPTPAFCAWCGLSLDEASPTRPAAIPSSPTGGRRPRPAQTQRGTPRLRRGGPAQAVSRRTGASRPSPSKQALSAAASRAA